MLEGSSPKAFGRTGGLKGALGLKAQGGLEGWLEA